MLEPIDLHGERDADLHERGVLCRECGHDLRETCDAPLELGESLDLIARQRGIARQQLIERRRQAQLGLRQAFSDLWRSVSPTIGASCPFSSILKVNLTARAVKDKLRRPHDLALSSGHRRVALGTRGVVPRVLQGTLPPGRAARSVARVAPRTGSPSARAVAGSCVGSYIGRSPTASRVRSVAVSTGAISTDGDAHVPYVRATVSYQRAALHPRA